MDQAHELLRMAASAAAVADAPSTDARRSHRALLLLLRVLLQALLHGSPQQRHSMDLYRSK